MIEDKSRSDVVNIDKHVLGLRLMTCVFDADTAYMLLIGIACVGVNALVGDKLSVLLAIYLVHVSIADEVD